MRKASLLMLFLLIAIFVPDYCPASYPWDVFRYGTIPFGKTESEITAMFSKANVRIDKWDYPHLFMLDYWVPKDYPIYSEFGRNSIVFDRTITHELGIRNFEMGGENNIKEIRLFFTKHRVEDSVYHLMAVEKFIDISKSSFGSDVTTKSAFDEIIKAFSEKIGAKPDTVLSSIIIGHKAYWNTGSLKIYFDFKNDFNAYISYLSEKEWNIYYPLTKRDVKKETKKATEKAVEGF